jgi:cell division protein FtsL
VKGKYSGEGLPALAVSEMFRMNAVTAVFVTAFIKCACIVVAHAHALMS